MVGEEVGREGTTFRGRRYGIKVELGEDFVRKQEHDENVEVLYQLCGGGDKISRRTAWNTQLLGQGLAR